MNRMLLPLALLAALPLASAARAEEHTVTFQNKDSIAGWNVTGDVSIDAGKTRRGAAGGSLRIGPGGRASWKLSDKDCAARIEFYVYEDGAVAAEPKEHGYGALWGVMTRSGHALVGGPLYARYLAGDSTYAMGEFDPAKAGDLPSLKCQYLGLKREVGWHKWTFNLEADKGLKILVDDKDVNGTTPGSRFDWNKTTLTGIASLFFAGDGTSGGKQVLWVHSVSVSLGQEMKSQPTPPPPPAALLPAHDPAPGAQRVTFLPTVANQHPRLLITADRIARLKAFYNSADGKLYHDEMESYIADCTVPADRKMSAAWGQEYGIFKLPMVALHYVLAGNKDSFDKSVAYLKWLAGQADWTDGGEPTVAHTPQECAKTLDRMMQLGPEAERNSDTTASFTMMGAALTWDWLYNDLDPAFREQFRQILWQHARAMYYGGHLGGNPDGGYWRGMPNYNHRWYRDWGLTLATLGAANGEPQEQWLLGEVERELRFNTRWLPVDGSQHEGPGYGASAGALGMAFEVSDELIGTHFLDTPFYAHAAAYTLQVSTPGMTESFYFADCFDKALSVHPFFLKTAAMHNQADVTDGIRHALRVNARKWGVNDYAWLGILCDDPAIKGGSYSKMPTTSFMPDVGVAVVRDSWHDDAVGARFKCGPMGGYQSNAWRLSAREPNGTLPYVNVAHDHPDANSFTLFGNGEYLAETDRYPLGPGKLSSSHNTILINGLGQAVPGREEGDIWQQPGNSDMSQMAKIVAFKDAGNVVVVEGEAAGAYLAYTDAKTKRSRPAIDRYRRTFIWVRGGYVLVFDDIRSAKPVDITWLIQGAKLTPASEGEGRYQLAKGSAQCEFQLVSDVAFTPRIRLSTANNHGPPKGMLNWQQLQATAAQATAARFVCALDPWHKGVKVAMNPDGPDKATIKLTGNGIDDTWQWTAATSKFEAATWHGSRPSGFTLAVEMPSAAPPAP